MKTQHKTLNEALQALKDIPLYSVEFVMDYVQLRFGGPTLTAFTHPSLQVDGKTVTWESPEFKDLLCGLIEIPVVETDVVKSEEVKLRFENGTTVLISLRENDYSGPEALEFVVDSGPSWVV